MNSIYISKKQEAQLKNSSKETGFLRLNKLILIIALSMMIAIFGCGGDDNDDDNSADVSLEVPFVPNYGMTCASSSFTMVLQYYSIDVTFYDVWDIVGFPPDYGAFDQWIRNNFDLRLEHLSSQTIDDIMQYIDEGCPPIVVQQHSYQDATGHNRVVIGYNPEKDYFILNDPSNLGPNYRLSFNTFVDLWDRFTEYLEPWWDPHPTFLIIHIDEPIP